MRRVPLTSPASCTPRSALALLAAAGLFLSACGDDGGPNVRADGGRGTTSTSSPDEPVTSPPSTGGTTPPGRPKRVEPQPGAVEVKPVSFDPSEAEATAGGVLVRFWGGIAPCFVLDRYEVSETPEAVTVTLYGGSAPGSEDVACIEIAMQYEVEVPLATPLGDRTLVDGSVVGGENP